VVGHALVHPVHREPGHVGQAGRGVAGAPPVQRREAVERLLGERPVGLLGRGQRGGDPPATALGEREGEQGAVGVEPRVDAVGREVPVDEDVGQHDRLLAQVARPAEGDAERPAHRAAPPVGADEPPRPHLLGAAGPVEPGHDRVAALPETGEGDAPLDPAAEALDQRGELLLGALLGDVEQEGVAGDVGGGERRAEGRTTVGGGLGGGDRDAGVDERLRDGQVVEDLQGARGDAGRARGRRGGGRPVDQPHADPATQQVGGEGQAGGSRADDQTSVLGWTDGTDTVLSSGTAATTSQRTRE
jgi:hypothetical protein